MYVKLLFLFVFFALSADAQRSEGDICYKDGQIGQCRNLRFCESAMEDLRHRIKPQTCSFFGTTPIVCCLDRSQDYTTTTTARPVTTTTTRRTVATTTRRSQHQSTTEYIPPVYDYKEDTGEAAECAPIDPKLTTPKTGKKAWDKCLEYQEKLVYPCEAGVALTGEPTRVPRCGHNADGLIVGGTDAEYREFPHMALLGFGSDVDSVRWMCGGSVISERFILTAGHCSFSREFGEVTYVAVGSLKKSELNKSKIYRVLNIVKHPNYSPPIKYDDIALIETEVMQLDSEVVPACVDVGAGARADTASASGWGLTTHRGNASDILQKVTLTKFTQEECKATFPPERKMKEGLRSTQICYGDRTQKKDTCQGDSGGPLQVNNYRIHCMYTIIGVTSFGKECGFEGVPAVYTKVQPYSSWIESVVWPDA